MVRPKRLGHLVIRVRDLERSEKFYTGLLGLKVTHKRPGQMVFLSAGDDSSHELAPVPVGADSAGPDPTRVGLYHFAWEMESFEDLQQLYNEMHAKNVKIGGLGDRGISLGVYLFDPDGNEIEAFCEMPKDQWPADGDLFSGDFPRTLEAPAPVTP